MISPQMEKSVLKVESQLIPVEGKIEIENHHLVDIIGGGFRPVSPPMGKVEHSVAFQ